jgi:hypothetical protein
VNRKLISIAVSVALALGLWGVMPTEKAFAAVTAISIDYFPVYIPNDGGTNCTTQGTPFAVRVTVTGDPSQNFALKVRLGTGGCTWRSDTATWTNDSTAYTSLPRGTLDGSGVATLWLYGRANSSATASLTVRARACDATFATCPTPNVDSAAQTVTLMNMTSAGGWLEESNGTSRAGRAVVVRNGSTIIGMYGVEENNVTEGYSSTPGYFRVAVPECATCGYTIETWDMALPGTNVGTVNTMGSNGCPNTVAVATITSLNACAVPTNITLKSVSASTTQESGALLIFAGALAATVGVIMLVRRRSRAA